MATTVTTHGGERYSESLVIGLCSGGGHNGGREHVDMWKEREKCLLLALDCLLGSCSHMVVRSMRVVIVRA